jgi:hypothetical protein
MPGKSSASFDNDRTIPGSILIFMSPRPFFTAAWTVSASSTRPFSPASVAKKPATNVDAAAPRADLLLRGQAKLSTEFQSDSSRTDSPVRVLPPHAVSRSVGEFVSGSTAFRPFRQR